MNQKGRTWTVLPERILLGCSLALFCVLGCASSIPGPRETARYEEAVSLYSGQKYKEAMKEAKPLLVRYPLWPEVSLLYAKAARASGGIEGRYLASHTLSRIIAHYPDRADLRRELASLNFEQGFYSYARAHYQELLRADERDSEAHYMLGLIAHKYWKRYRDTADLSRIIAELSRSIQLDSLRADSYRRLSMAYLEKGRRDSLDTVTSSMLKLLPAEPDAHMLRAIALHGNGKYEEELAEWQRYFSLSDSATVAPFDDISLLITLSQKAELARLDEGGRARFLRGFWKNLDPTPTTQLNERVLEHWYRVGLSGLLFRDETAGIPGWETAPGQVFVRYGMPEQERSGVSIWAEGGNIGVPVLVWSYKDEMGSFQASFYDYMLSGSYSYFQFSTVPSALDERIYYHPTSYEHDYGAEVYPCFFAAAGFLRGSGVREELYVGVPLERVTRGDWRRVPVNLAVFDTLWNEVVSVSTTMASARTFASGQGAALVHEMGLPLSPGRYTVAVAVRDSLSGTLGMAKEDITVPALHTDSLDVSDIELAYTIPAQRFFSGISKDGAIVPNPSGVYVAPERVWLYYEVYNLAQNADGKCRFVARYSIVPVKKEGSTIWEFITSIVSPGEHYIVNSLEREVESPSSSEQMAIDVSSLSRGSYSLVLSIRDLTSGAVAETERPFEKASAPKPKGEKP